MASARFKQSMRQPLRMQLAALPAPPAPEGEREEERPDPAPDQDEDDDDELNIFDDPRIVAGNALLGPRLRQAWAAAPHTLERWQPLKMDPQFLRFLVVEDPPSEWKVVELDHAQRLGYCCGSQCFDPDALITTASVGMLLGVPNPGPVYWRLCVPIDRKLSEADARHIVQRRYHDHTPWEELFD